MGFLCNRCNKAHATVHLTDILYPSNEKVERHYCDRCAADEGLQPVDKAQTTTHLIEQIVASSKTLRGSASNLVCEQCGMSYVQYRNEGLLGCPHDYTAFREGLVPLLERWHEKGAHHTGKTPRSAGQVRTTEQDIQRLRRLLAEAVAGEDYERAAQLRDRIRVAESG
jgi:protein arginine kinase activator